MIKALYKISPDDLKVGTYLQTINNHGRLVLKITEVDLIITSKITNKPMPKTDYTREEKLKNLGL